MIDLSRARIPPYDHQRLGVEKLTLNPYFFLADEMGAGKTKQTIDAAQVLFTHGGVIDQVLVLAPAAVRSVWFDPELGELKKHLWEGVNARVVEYHAKKREWTTYDTVRGAKGPVMTWVITNYDFIRQQARLEPLLSSFVNKRTLLVLDESSAIKNPKALQTKAAMNLRKKCGRVVLLNGTPISNSPGDMFSQGNIMDPKILECKSWFVFRSKYAIMGGWQNRQIVKWTNLEDLQRRFAPYILRRLKTDCLDLPAKLPPVTMTCALTHETWEKYREMRDELVVWLDQATASVASQAGVKAMRLAQITSGFLGGLLDPGIEVDDAMADALMLETEADDRVNDGRPDWLPKPDHQMTRQDAFRIADDRTVVRKPGPIEGTHATKEIGREKLDLVMSFIEDRLAEDPNLKLLVWCRFRPELARMLLETNSRFKQVTTGAIWGTQTRDERAAAIRLLDPRTAPKGPAIVYGTPASGSMGLNLTACHTVLYASNDYSLKTRLQSEDRVHRPGQVDPVWYGDVVATGPNGQRTIDHIVLKALRAKEDLATWTTRAWLQALKEDIDF